MNELGRVFCSNAEVGIVLFLFQWLWSQPGTVSPESSSLLFVASNFNTNTKTTHLCWVERNNLIAMGPRSRYLLGALIFAVCLAEASETIYDVLKKYGLPIGLLPKAVQSYSLDDAGSFEVNLAKPCYAKFESQVYYETTVRGNLSYGQITGLSGVEAQELFLWFPVKGIRVDIPSSGFIYFDVGVISKQYSLSLFETPPDCKGKGDYVSRKALQ